MIKNKQTNRDENRSHAWRGRGQLVQSQRANNLSEALFQIGELDLFRQKIIVVRRVIFLNLKPFTQPIILHTLHLPAELHYKRALLTCNDVALHRRAVCNMQRCADHGAAGG